MYGIETPSIWHQNGLGGADVVGWTHATLLQRRGRYTRAADGGGAPDERGGGVGGGLGVGRLGLRDLGDRSLGLGLGLGALLVIAVPSTGTDATHAEDGEEEEEEEPWGRNVRHDRTWDGG